jgi:hypothetical protein
VKSFCTYFDHRYLIRGLTLYRSLAAHVPDLQFHVLCFDEQTHRALTTLNWPGVHATSIADLEDAVPDLAAVKTQRSTLEYYFTSTPAWIQFILRRMANDEVLTFVDADLFFYSSPAAIANEVADADIVLSPHRFSPTFLHLEQCGKFNVGLLAFRQGEEAERALVRWREQCIEWCFDHAEAARFGDQKYLDEWPAMYNRVHALQHPGAGLAPWNWRNHQLSVMGSSPLVDERPLVFFHFHGLRTYGGGLYDLGPYGAPPTQIRRVLYDGYIASLHETQKLVSAVAGDFPIGAGLMRTSVPRYVAGLAKRILKGQRSVFMARKPLP